MLSAKDIMNREVVTVRPETEITAAARIMLDRKINGVPVVNDKGTVVGILCQSDLIVQQKKMPIPSLFTFLDGLIALTSMKQLEKEVRKIAATVVADAMSPDPVTVKPDTSIETVAALMVDNSFHTLPVVENGRLVGIIGKADVLRTLTGENA